eukprot:gnl/MRDRNA2_/MRDRNA2_312294_c0_seq1.p1 gnl/MRDRNA2_/MRDRNA2_312294_c0~~gnl/MRDRNA2_/MRDRNA2_312294_c0_seq1.p1  ORF type:complete len:361 (+),score=50.23 gnl/MRDRNA2_/MRDRNA2_312294_c0_seq1:17-1099(+)
MRAQLLLAIQSALLVEGAYHEPDLPGIVCSFVKIPNLTDVDPFAHSARVCHPNVSVTNLQSFPLHVLAHGDMGGGPVAYVYNGLQEQIASFGFVVVVHHSCAFSPFECDNGQAAFLEILKTLRYFESAACNSFPVDLSKPYSVSGHSTGARAVLMLAALKDTPAYLAKTKYAGLITESMRKSLRRVAVVISDHPDPMYDLKQNPDVANFAVSETPVFIITGSKDTPFMTQQGVGEPLVSAWNDFLMIAPPAKIFVDIAGASHLQPIQTHPEGPFIAYAIQFFALGNSTAGELLYGNGPTSLQQTLPIAQPGSTNTGANEVGFLACGHNHDGSFAVPAKYSKYCNASATLPFRTADPVVLV